MRRKEGELLQLAPTTPSNGIDRAARRLRIYCGLLLGFLALVGLMFVMRAHGLAVAGAPILVGMLGCMVYTFPAWVTYVVLRRRRTRCRAPRSRDLDLPS